jgi:hypothetical protein
VNRPRSYFAACFAGTFVVAGLLVLGSLGACSDQGEGERCESLNGNDDCSFGLICTPAALLQGTVSDRCCPQDRGAATAPVCKAPVSGVGDAQAPADTGPPPATPDATVNDAETGVTDAPSEGG